MLDLEDPARVNGLAPEIYYGAADTSVAVATADLEELLATIASVDG
jgi:predicted GH43/DUF377 family glycosyl hydrolase